MRVVKRVNATEGKTFEERVKKTLHSLIAKNNDNHIVKLDIYVNSTDLVQFKEEYECFADIIQTEFKNKIPAHSIIYQPLLGNDEFVILAQMYEQSTVEVQYKTLLKHAYVTVKTENSFELFSGAIAFNEDSLLFSTQRCFDFAEQILMAEDLNFGHIYRQYNYIPNVSGASDYDRNKRANLNIFNEVKDLFFEEPLFINGKPLVSNLNNCDSALVIDFNAFQQENMDQQVGFNENLLSESLNAKLIFNDINEFWYYTKPELSSSYSDIEKETIASLKNIFLLKEAANITFDQTKKNFKFIKVFIKESYDNMQLEETILKLLPDTEIILFKSDILPANSNIEIEGMLSC